MCFRRRYSSVYTVETDKPHSRSLYIHNLEKLTNQEIADIIATTPRQQDIQQAYRTFYTRQRYCEEDLFELFITALAKRRGC